jgi:hypothetical protein
MIRGLNKHRHIAPNIAIIGPITGIIPTNPNIPKYIPINNPKIPLFMKLIIELYNKNL